MTTERRNPRRRRITAARSASVAVQGIWVSTVTCPQHASGSRCLRRDRRHDNPQCPRQRWWGATGDAVLDVEDESLASYSEWEVVGGGDVHDDWRRWVYDAVRRGSNLADQNRGRRTGLVERNHRRPQTYRPAPLPSPRPSRRRRRTARTSATFFLRTPTRSGVRCARHGTDALHRSSAGGTPAPCGRYRRGTPHEDPGSPSVTHRPARRPSRPSPLGGPHVRCFAVVSSRRLQLRPHAVRLPPFEPHTAVRGMSPRCRRCTRVGSYCPRWLSSCSLHRVLTKATPGTANAHVSVVARSTSNERTALSVRRRGGAAR